MNVREVAVEHRWLLLLLGAAVCLRAAVMVAYPGAFVGSEDALTYLGMSWAGAPVRTVADRPSGYSAFVIELLSPLGRSLTPIAVAQHLMGLVTAGAAYAVCRRLGCHTGVALGAAAVLAFDSFLLTSEHWVLTETAATTFAFVALALTAFTDRTAAIAAAGFLLGAAVTMRTAMVFAVPVWLGFVLWKRRPWAVVVPALVALALAPLAHMAWYQHKEGVFGMSKLSGWFLYARIGKIGNCGNADIPPQARPMCPMLLNPAPDPRTHLWGGLSSPAHQVFGGPTTGGLDADPILRDFAIAIIRDRPIVYTRMIGRDMLRYFDPRQDDIGAPLLSQAPSPIPETHLPTAEELLPGFEVRRRAPAAALDVYGDVVHVPRPLFGISAFLALLLALAALVRPLRGLVPARAEALLMLGAGFALVLGATATSGYIWRYLLPAIPPLVCGIALVADGTGRAWLARRGARRAAPASPGSCEPPMSAGPREAPASAG